MELYGKKLKCIGSGLECRVYSIDKTTVLKMYCSRGERSRAYARQLKAHKEGFGPQVYEKLNILTEKEFKYGYISQRAKSGLTMSIEQLARLEKAARRFKWRTGDIHEYNAGFVLMPVIVDFGDASLQ